MTSMTQYAESVKPTRRLNSKESKVFQRVLTEFSHLTSSDAETLTTYSEAVVRYETAAKECKRNPTVQVPIVNRASGNVVGEKSQRNPSFATMKEAFAQVTTLSRRLLIDAASANKRQTLMTKKARALRAAEEAAAKSQTVFAITEEQIQQRMHVLLNVPTPGVASSDHPMNRTLAPDVLRAKAIMQLETDAQFIRWAEEEKAEAHLPPHERRPTIAEIEAEWRSVPLSNQIQ